MLENGTAALLFHDKTDRLAWCYRNQSSVWGANLANQNTPEMVAKTKDPILHRTSGCVLTAKGFARSAPASLASRSPVKAIDCSIRVLTSQPTSVQAWLADAERPVKSDWTAHLAYWKAFWDRSHIFVSRAGEGTYQLDQCRFTQFPQASQAYEGFKEIPAAQNAFQISQRYVLERFRQAWIGTPDNDHGTNSVNTLQAMLVQSDGDKIHVLPVWPEDWDVSFKLTAAINTTVEGFYQNGRLAELRVTPESRRKAIIDHSTPEARIQTLIDIARAAVSAGSHTLGKSGTTIDLGEAKTFDRLEFTIDNPNYQRGQAKSFEKQIQQADGNWTAVHKGHLYGMIYSKRFAPASGQHVRLVIDAPLRQFDLFPPGR